MNAATDFRDVYVLSQKNSSTFDISTFQGVVEKSLLQGYLLEDGVRDDDTIDLTTLRMGVLHVKTSSRSEMDIVMSRLRVIEKSLSGT